MAWSDQLMISLDERAIEVQTARGPVQLARDGAGPPVLAIHGGPGGFDQALAYCRHLRDGGCELLAPSRPGYLRTPLRSGASPDAQADLYAALLDELHIERTAILAVSSGGPSALQFAARHPDRTTALLLDAAILRPFKPPITALQRMTIESGLVVRVLYQIASRKPELMARFAIDGMSAGLGKDQRRSAVRWIMADPSRLQSLQEQFASIAPRQHRKTGWANDQANESQMAQLPFDDIAAPTLIAHGANDAIVPVDHATNAAAAITDAELMLVEEGHHLLSSSRHYGPVAVRQLELAHARIRG